MVPRAGYEHQIRHHSNKDDGTACGNFKTKKLTVAAGVRCFTQTHSV